MAEKIKLLKNGKKSKKINEEKARQQRQKIEKEREEDRRKISEGLWQTCSFFRKQTYAQRTKGTAKTWAKLNELKRSMMKIWQL